MLLTVENELLCLLVSREQQAIVISIIFCYFVHSLCCTLVQPAAPCLALTVNQMILFSTVPSGTL